MLEYENKAKGQGYRLIIGLDEAGRGPLAGPVVAAAVALKSYNFESKINDSKKMSAKARDKAFHEIYEKATIGVGVISEMVIDSHNILQATFFAMNNAILQLMSRLPLELSEDESKVKLLIDGNQFKTDLPYRYETIIGGDAKSLSIACASIVAKVTRDRILDTYDRIYPMYGFSQHKGYPTVKHRQAIREYGPSDVHRKTFHVK